MNLFAACFVLLLLLLAGKLASNQTISMLYIVHRFILYIYIHTYICAGAPRVAESRRHRHHHHDDDDDGGSRSPPAAAKQQRTQKLFVFGDDFADTGNGASDPGLGYNSREWRYPFGMSDTAHARRPSGRFSDGLVQSDFMAKIMGHREAPPPYTYDDWHDGIDDAGLNFAVGESGALETPAGVTKLGKQVQQLRRLIRDGLVERRDLRDSVALVAYSGNDYAYADDDVRYDRSIYNFTIEIDLESI
jgi:hypothetical protein